MLTVWMVKDIAPQSQPGAPTLLEKRDKQNTQQETWPNSPLSSRLDVSTFTFDCLSSLLILLL
jgi:hypothetical protein